MARASGQLTSRRFSIVFPWDLLTVRGGRTPTALPSLALIKQGRSRAPHSSILVLINRDVRIEPRNHNPERRSVPVVSFLASSIRPRSQSPIHQLQLLSIGEMHRSANSRRRRAMCPRSKSYMDQLNKGPGQRKARQVTRMTSMYVSCVRVHLLHACTSPCTWLAIKTGGNQLERCRVRLQLATNLV
jgi:hypothetical protein